jgi:long-chain acyl-CoA synthetase
MLFDDFITMGKSKGIDGQLQERLSKVQSDDLSTLIYTSGTTGEPKGVMLTHKNWFAMLFGTGYHIPVEPTDVNLAFLPLSHVFERAWSYFILCNNTQVVSASTSSVTACRSTCPELVEGKQCQCHRS